MKSKGHQVTLHFVTLISSGLGCRNSWWKKWRSQNRRPGHPGQSRSSCSNRCKCSFGSIKSCAKETDVKSPPTGKSKGHGKPLSAEENAKTPCIFHQMPSGCVHGAKCAYSHSKAPPAKPKSEGNADSKPKPKTAPAAAAAAKTLATVTILAATMLQPSQAGLIELAAHWKTVDFL